MRVKSRTNAHPQKIAHLVFYLYLFHRGKEEGGGGRLFGRLRWVHLEPPNKVRLGCRHSILHYFVGTAILVLSGLTQLVPALHMEVPFENATSKPLDTKSENSDYIVSFPVADSFSIFGERKNVSCDFRQRFR